MVQARLGKIAVVSQNPSSDLPSWTRLSRSRALECGSLHEGHMR
jgi:hypothetical protein